jgi:MtN3 and saliva related transmembrane protein
MSLEVVEAIGFVAAVLTTLCWLPQAFKILRERQTAGISLPTQIVFTAGVACWLVYGIALGSPSVTVANALTLMLSAAILALKLRYG